MGAEVTQHNKNLQQIAMSCPLLMADPVYMYMTLGVHSQR